MSQSRKQIIDAAKAVLYARRSGNVKREQAAFNRLHKACGDTICPFDAISQVESHLRATSVAAHMNGIV